MIVPGPFTRADAAKLEIKMQLSFWLISLAEIVISLFLFMINPIISRI
ncbi:MAG: hypothetical protein KKC75_08825 [Nanoarchaeota archaeon]|nr:hypothetical protein [Nanoarchaeota archaeon]